MGLFINITILPKESLIFCKFTADMAKKLIEVMLIALTFVVLSVLLIAAMEKEKQIDISRMEQFFKQEDRVKEHIIQVSNNDR